MFHVKHENNSEDRFKDLKAILPNVSRETFDDLEAYTALLRHWQQRINLVANATLPVLWQRHILDSVQLFPLAEKAGGAAAKNWLDVGSGGGFPGLVLAILIKHCDGKRITLIESNGKKAAFLRMVAAKLHLPARILNQRIEASYDLGVQPDIITARALAELPSLLRLIAPFLGEQTLALLQKGQGFTQEIEQARRGWQFDVRCHSSLVDQDSVILAIRNLCLR